MPRLQVASELGDALHVEEATQHRRGLHLGWGQGQGQDWGQGVAQGLGQGLRWG